MTLLVGREEAGDNHAGFNTEKISEHAFLPIIWSLIATSFIFLPIRLWARWRAFKRFYWDDGLTILAWFFAIGLGVVASWISKAIYSVMAYEFSLQAAKRDASARGETYPDLIADATRKVLDSTIPLVPPKETEKKGLREREWRMDQEGGLEAYTKSHSIGMARGSILSYVLLYFCLWSIKFNFLLFFYRLGVQSIRNLNWHWWIVSVVTFLALVGCFPSLPYYCSFGGDEAMTGAYCAEQQGMSFVSMKVNCGLDVATDAIIMTIPLNILWRTRIPKTQKLALLGLFSLVVITIAVAIVRATVVTLGVSKQQDLPWVLVWTSIEANIAIIVACIGSFRMLFVQHQKHSRPHRDSFKMMGKPPAHWSWRRTPQTPIADSAWTADEIIPEGRRQTNGFSEWQSGGEQINWKDGRYLRSGPITEEDL